MTNKMNKDPWKVKEKKQKKEERKLQEGDKQKFLGQEKGFWIVILGAFIYILIRNLASG